MSDQKELREKAERYIKSLGAEFFNGDRERFIAMVLTNELDPIMGDIVYQPRKDRDRRPARGSIITSFEVFLKKAHQTGCFLGTTDTIIHDDSGKLIGVKVEAHRETASGKIAKMDFTAFLSDFMPDKSSGYSPWVKMPYVMLRKCAISNAVRQLFADVVRLPYTKEEMGQSGYVEEEKPQNIQELKEESSYQAEPKIAPWMSSSIDDFIFMLSHNKFYEAVKNPSRLQKAFETIRDYWMYNFPNEPCSAVISEENAIGIFKALIEKAEKNIKEKYTALPDENPFEKNIEYTPPANLITDKVIQSKILALEVSFDKNPEPPSKAMNDFLHSEYKKAYGKPFDGADIFELIDGLKSAFEV